MSTAIVTVDGGEDEEAKPAESGIVQLAIEEANPPEPSFWKRRRRGAFYWKKKKVKPAQNSANQKKRTSLKDRLIGIFSEDWRFPIACMVGTGVTAGTCVVLVRFVHHWIETAKVDPNPDHWTAKGLNAYTVCYDGCNDCHDLEAPYRACQDTSMPSLQGIECDASNMWNWGAAKYPPECVEALGKIYKAGALASLKTSFRQRLAIILCCVAAGAIAYLFVYYLWPRHQRQHPVRAPYGPEHYGHMDYGRHGHQSRSSRASRNYPRYSPYSRSTASSQRGQSVINPRSLTLAYLTTGAHAFACFGRGTHDQYFTNANNSISGLIHGWVSDCQSESTECGQNCEWHHSPYSWSPAVIPSCSTNWCNHERETASPKSYVLAAARLVEQCGFSLVNAVSHDVGARIPNPKIERDMWVKISVSKFNVTEETDPGVICLYDIFH